MKISVITPSFNQGDYLERTILSVVPQNYADLEYIIMDGGSTDQSVEIIKKYQRDIKHWVSEKDGGQTDAVNRGFHVATGEILGWLNSDDIYYSKTLQTVADYFSSHPECDVIYGMADYIDADDNLIDKYPTRSWSFSELKSWCFICQPSVFFRKTVYEQYGPLDNTLNFCMDYEYWLRCGQEKPFVYVREKLAASRLYSENKTIGSRPAVIEEIVRMLFKKHHHVQRRWLGERALEITGLKRGFEPKGISRISWSADALRKWYLDNIKFNRGFLPLVPMHMIMNLPIVPRRLLQSLKQAIQRKEPN